MASDNTRDDLYVDDEYSAPRKRWMRRLGGGLGGRLSGGLIGRSFAVLVLLVALYYGAGAAIINTVDDDTSFATAAVPPGASRAVEAAAALVERETDTHGWTPNDPFFLPGSILDNMPNFQQGVVKAASRFSVEMMDHIGRLRGTSQIDGDLERAAGLLKYPGNVWVWDPSVSLAPTATSESQYRAAVRALRSYNSRLANGQTVFDRRGDNLMSALERIASDLGSASAQIDGHITHGPFWLFDTDVDDIFYSTKGQLYAHYVILNALGQDFEQVLRERQLDGVWQQMLDGLKTGAELEPLIVIGGSPDALLLPNHLTAQGFYLLRARTQLYEVVNILLK